MVDKLIDGLEVVELYFGNNIIIRVLQNTDLKVQNKHVHCLAISARGEYFLNS